MYIALQAKQHSGNDNNVGEWCHIVLSYSLDLFLSSVEGDGRRRAVGGSGLLPMGVDSAPTGAFPSQLRTIPYWS